MILGRALVHLLARQTIEPRRSYSLSAGRRRVDDDNAAAVPRARPDNAAPAELPVEDPLGAAEVKVEADAGLVGGGAVDGRPRVSQVLRSGDRDSIGSVTQVWTLEADTR